MLAPAIDIDPGNSPERVFGYLVSGQYEAATLHSEGAAGVVVTEICAPDGYPVLWLPYIVGETGLAPRAFVRLMRRVMTMYEDMAREAGAEEIRIGGRDWSRVFPDFERFDDKPNRLRKRL